MTGAQPPNAVTIWAATSNAGKLRDFALASAALGIQLEPLPGLAGIEPPAEDEDSFEGNARVKAVFYSRFAPGAWVLADDSGLEVDALDGRPGVRSARFALDLGMASAPGSLDASNNEALLLTMLEQVDRSARYRCVLALARDGRVEQVSSGAVDGEILSGPEGDGGFGYDPLFFVPELGCSMAEASLEDRLRLSHRGRALRQLLLDCPSLVGGRPKL